MTTSSVTSVGGASPASTTLGMQDLLKILLTQLQYQDPTQPMDNAQFVAQIAQFATLDQTKQMADSITQLVASESLTQSVGLLGRTVGYTVSSTSSGSGQVTSISLSNGTPTMTITASDGTVTNGISVSQLTSVK
ncbi:flagellar hook capping FlgD N-terminal domain-containing protein [Paraburkholderia ferrariae]|jgi:flagellar basal-body rod modification protein FlgD|uniref:Basal-body rod modification protein FlgD n=1 Tax=Paraburkholderia ferrariae TaxID=386056 RepID=A0ABU9RMG6_9BURK